MSRAASGLATDCAAAVGVDVDVAVVVVGLVVVEPVVVGLVVVLVCADAEMVGSPSASTATADVASARRLVGLVRLAPSLAVVMPNLLLLSPLGLVGESLRGVGKSPLAETWQVGKSRCALGQPDVGSST